jgi:hypothetical protein
MNPYIQVGTNLVKINFKGEDPEKHCFAIVIELIGWLNRDEAVGAVLAAPKFSLLEFAGLIYPLFNPNDDDCVIVQDKVRLSLTCPLTLQRMKLPVRSRACKHVNVRFTHLGVRFAYMA